MTPLRKLLACLALVFGVTGTAVAVEALPAGATVSNCSHYTEYNPSSTPGGYLSGAVWCTQSPGFYPWVAAKIVCAFGDVHYGPAVSSAYVLSRATCTGGSNNYITALTTYYG